MYQNAAKKNLFFTEQNDAFKSSILPELSFRRFKNKDKVYKKGDYADEIYFITKGTVCFIDEEITFRKMLDGAHFGEFEVIDHIKRKFDVKCLKPCEMLIMNL